MKKIFFRILLIIIAILVIVPATLVVLFLIANQTNGEMQSSGETRRYLLYVPKSYDPAKPTPLVISIHGFAEWPAHQRDITHWNSLADEYDFIVVYPSGTGFFPMHWRTKGESGSANDPMRDVQFISDLIDKLESEYNIDPARIYANGLSNGGGMSFLLACKLSDRIAAIGGVSGAYLTPWSDCAQTRPVPMIAFHGTEDPVVPYQGGPSPMFDINFPVIPDWVAELARHNGCDPAPIQLPPIAEVNGVQYTTCAQNAEVVFYTIATGGHSWPGGDPLPEFIVGRTSQSIDATRIMWEFFQKHPLE